MNDLSIVVMSCDKNRWLLNIFFRQFYLEWSDCCYNINLVIEEQDYCYAGRNINVFKNSKNIKWCARLKAALEQIEEKYILLFLDDFILESPVNEKLLDDYLSIVKKNELSNLILTPVENEKDDKEVLDERMKKRNRFGRYKTSLQCGIWDKCVLQELLLNSENAWEFELFGNLRSFLFRDKFYAVSNRDVRPFDYNDGFFAVQGRVNLEEKNRIEKKVGINIELDHVPVFEKTEDIIRDDISLPKRIVRRGKIIMEYIYYRLKYILGVRKI